jgi:hypothetical protein
MTPDRIARLLVAQLEALAPDPPKTRYAHGKPIPAPSKRVAEHAARCAYALARETHPNGLAEDRLYSFNVERTGRRWQVVAVIVLAP